MGVRGSGLRLFWVLGLELGAQGSLGPSFEHR